MVAALRVFGGADSRGHGVEVAESVTGAWFMREHCFNGYAMGWTKWTPCAAPTFKLEGVNVYTGEPVHYTPGTLVNWGFKALEVYKAVPKYRLPG